MVTTWSVVIIALIDAVDWDSLLLLRNCLQCLKLNSPPAFYSSVARPLDELTQNFPVSAKNKYKMANSLQTNQCIAILQNLIHFNRDLQVEVM